MTNNSYLQTKVKKFLATFFPAVIFSTFLSGCMRLLFGSSQDIVLNAARIETKKNRKNNSA